MHIDFSLPRSSLTKPSPATDGAHSISAAHLSAVEARSTESAVDAAHRTALSALKNERFGMMLAKISEPAAAGALMTMTRDSNTASTDFNSAVASYAENAE